MAMSFCDSASLVHISPLIQLFYRSFMSTKDATIQFVRTSVTRFDSVVADAVHALPKDVAPQTDHFHIRLIPLDTP